MKFRFAYTAVRVRDMDRAIDFYTNVLGMNVLGREKRDDTKGEFATLGNGKSPHTLELNWYEDDSPVAGPYREGEELDHLAFAVGDLDAALTFLAEKGYPKASDRWRVRAPCGRT